MDEPGLDVAFKFDLRRYVKGDIVTRGYENDPDATSEAGPGSNRPISVYHLGEMPIQSCGQASALRAGKRAPG
jgi:hypothetical protein